MNREINFRGLTSGSGKWVFGDLIQLDNDTLIAGKDMEAGEFKNGYIELAAISVNPETVGLFTGLLDKHNNPIYEGDIVIGCYSWMKGDGYKKKGFPDRVRFLFEVKWSDGKPADVGFYLDQIGVHPGDKFATDEYFYRSVGFSLRESRECELKDNKTQWNGCNKSLEIIGNRHSNPELLSH